MLVYGKKRKTRKTAKKAVRKVTKPRGIACDNRTIRNAINVASGYLYGHRGSPEKLRKAIDVLSSCDLSRGYGRRGGVTRSNAAAALKYMALYELKTGKRLTKMGGFSRKALNEAKKIMKEHEEYRIAYE